MALFPYKTAVQLCLLYASCTLLSAGQPSQEAQFLKRMKEYWKEGDFETAKRQIRSYLEQNSKADLQEEMHILLGDLYLKEGNFLSALEEYRLVQKEELLEKIFYNKALCFYETDQIDPLFEVAKTFASQPQLSPEQKNSIRYLCASAFFEHCMKAPSKNMPLLDKAKELFESCAGTSFENLSFYPLARLNELFGMKKQAASYYEAASKIHPDFSADFLFQAALLRSDVAPDLAIATFEKIFSSESPKQSEALYNSLLLQYKTKQFKEFVSCYEKHQSILTPEHTTSISHFFGKSLYHLGEFEKAIDPLLESLDSSSSASVKKTAQLMLLECAYKIQNVELYHKMFRHPSLPLVNDENYSKAHLVYLNLLKLREKYPEFIEESKVFVQQNPDHPEKEQVLWDAGYFLYQAKEWGQAGELFSSFVTDHPASSSTPNAWRLQLNCALFELQSCPLETASKHRKKLIAKIQQVFGQPDVLSLTEKETFSFELVKTLFLEGNFDEALAASKNLLTENAQTRFMEDLELLQTLCYLSHPKHQTLFIEHAERLLAKSSEISEADKIRLHLFNAYIQKLEQTPDEQKRELLSKAADHLYIVFERKAAPLKTENVQWLAEHYYDLSKTLLEDPVAPSQLKQSYLQRSIDVFESLLPEDALSLEGSSEAILLRLSSLLSWTEQFEKKAALLDKFLMPGELTQSPIQRQLILELAEAHQQTGDSLKALGLYNALIQNYPSSSIRALAVLGRSNLLVSYLPKDQQNDENPTFAQNLNDLKDLEVQRSLLSEPLHLEAGLEYIHWKSSLLPDDTARKQKQIQLLTLFKENFQSELETELESSSDPALVEKKQWVSSYLAFVDMKIAALEMTLQETPERMQMFKENAASLLEGLMKQTALPDPLRKRIKSSQQDSGYSL